MQRPRVDEVTPSIRVIRMAGPIQPPTSALAGGRSINLAQFEEQLSSAFRAKNTKAVAIEMNSPGGSPAQSSLLNSRISCLRAKYKEVPVLCYCTDVCASGGYYIAAACDEILVLPSTIVGSIGVVSPSIGLVDTMNKLGIQDRTQTSGKSKLGDSPLQPSDPVAVAKKQALLTELHDDFIDKVKRGRAGKLRPEAATKLAAALGDTDPGAGLFDGSVCAGTTSVQLGLADSLYADMEEDLRSRYGEDIRILAKQPSALQQLFSEMQASGAHSFATAFVGAFASEVASVLATLR